MIAKKTVIVDPHSEVFIPEQSVGNAPSQVRWIVTEGLRLDGLLIGRTLVDLSCETLPVRALNLSNEKYRVNKGDELAIGTPVLSVSLPHQTENLQGSPTMDAHVADFC